MPFLKKNPVKKSPAQYINNLPQKNDSENNPSPYTPHRNLDYWKTYEPQLCYFINNKLAENWTETLKLIEISIDFNKNIRLYFEKNFFWTFFLQLLTPSLAFHWLTGALAHWLSTGFLFSRFLASGFLDICISGPLALLLPFCILCLCTFWLCCCSKWYVIFHWNSYYSDCWCFLQPILYRTTLIRTWFYIQFTVNAQLWKKKHPLHSGVTLLQNDYGSEYSTGYYYHCSRCFTLASPELLLRCQQKTDAP